jgi:putative ABC transport system permease protein
MLSAWQDRWQEIAQALWYGRRTRTLITALSVAWGIFLLVVLLATGRAVTKGTEAEFHRNAQNSVFVYPGRLSRPHQGNPAGKQVQLRNEDHERARQTVATMDRSSARADMGTRMVRQGRLSSGFTVKGCLPDNQLIENSVLVAGRFVNQWDQRERRKVAVIGTRVERFFYPASQPAVGSILEIDGASFLVVGVFDEAGDQVEQETIYLPLATAQQVWGRGDRIERLLFTLEDVSARRAAEDVAGLRRSLARRHGFAPEDNRAVFVWNDLERFERFRDLFEGMRAFVWLVGLGTLLAAVLGVSNIMLISVHERTREIGVRKALGATSGSIINMIVQESLLVTTVSGCAGLVAGVLVVFAAERLIPPTPYFQRPEVDLTTGVAAVAVLVVAGVLAGLFPALRAVRVNPITALRNE